MDIAIKDPGVRRDVAYTLEGDAKYACARDRSAWRKLIEALRDKDPGVRRDAAYVVGRVAPYASDQSAEAVGPLCTVLTDDPDPRVRREAAWTLGPMADLQVVEFLAPLLADERLRQIVKLALRRAGLGSQVREQAIETLARLEEPENAGFFVGRLLYWEHGVQVDAASKALRGWLSEPAVRWLRDVSLKSGYGQLLDISTFDRGHPDPVQTDAAVRDALVAALKDSDWRARGKAALLLGKLGDPRAVQPLIELLEDPLDGPYYSGEVSWYGYPVRAAALKALGEIGDEWAASALTSVKRATNGFGEGERRMASWALRRIRGT